MKNTNLINKLKTEPKFRKNVIAITASSLVLVICAVSIPVGLYVRNSKVQQDTAENITVPVTDVTTSSVGPDEVSTTEPTTIAALVNETTTAPVVTTQKQNNKTGNSNDGNSSSTSNNKPASGSSNSSSSGSGNKTNNQSKPTTTKAPSTTKKQPQTNQISKEDLNLLVAKWKIYGENLGMTWDDSLSIEAHNASWSSGQPIWYDTDLDKLYKRVCEEIYDKHTGGAKAMYFKVIIVDENGDGYNGGCKWSTCLLYI